MQVYEVGLHQLRLWLATGRISDPCAGIPELTYDLNIGDHVAIGSAQLKHLYIRAWNHEITQEIKDGGFEIWEIVDDYDSLFGYAQCDLCGRWVLQEELCGEIDECAFEYGECGYSLVCSDDKACREFRTRKEQLKTLEALRQLRDAGDFPLPAIVPDQPTCIKYDVFRYDHALGRFVCCGANLRYADARELVRRVERNGTVSYLAESEGVGVHHG